MAQSDPGLSTNQQALPPLSREALHRIEQAEKDAEERYYRDAALYFPTHPDFSFFEGDILRARERILECVRLFAVELLDAHLKEYLEVEPLALSTNRALLKSVARNVWTLTERLWVGYTNALFLEPKSRREQYGIAMARGTMDQHPELETRRYPDQEQWADCWRRLNEPDSEMASLDARFSETIGTTVADLIRQYQGKAAFRLGVKPVDPPETNQEGQTLADPAKENIAAAQFGACSERAGTRSSTPAEASRELSGRTEGDQMRKPSPVVLSKRDAEVHDIVGGDNFCNLTNAEIMKDRGIKKRLRTECELEPGSDAAKACLDRIRRAKSYPLSRQITEKRSSQQ